MKKGKVCCWDLEGPISVIDFAAEIGKRLSKKTELNLQDYNMGEFFFMISNYDDYLIDNPEIKELIDYDAFCGVVQNVDEILLPDWNITPIELKTSIDLGKKIRVLDVRQPQEYAISRIPESELIPLANLEVNLHTLNRTDEIVVMCRSGIRSAQAVKFLRDAGFQPNSSAPP